MILFLRIDFDSLCRSLFCFRDFFIIEIGENDIWIAAIAIQNHLTIVTADRYFQRMQQVRTLSIESWI